MEPSFVTRFFLAFVAFFKVLFDASFAAGVIRLRESDAPAPGGPLPALSPTQPARLPTPSPATVMSDTPALSLLAVLQREGRFVDFLQEDISGFGDADVGAAARLVHEGCRKALAEYLTIEPLRTEGEGAEIVVEKGFDAGAIRLTGNVTGEPPFKGALRHHGWRVRELKLPRPSGDAKIIAPAEVEL
jgi:hypothetical protein